MKLFDAVTYLNVLNDLDAHSNSKTATRYLEDLLYVVANHPTGYESLTQELKEHFAEIDSHTQKFVGIFEQLKHNLISEIVNQEPEFLRESMRRFLHEMPFESNEYILSRRLRIDDDGNIALRSRIRNLGDWRLPGMILRPGLETFIEELVPLDPLYLVDHHEDLLKPAVEKFTPDYQRRLRQYVIDDRQDGPILSQLPDDQFGFVFAYNYFNFKPIEILRRYLDEIMIKLRPGGTFIFTYNNCDIAQGVGLAESGFMTYMPYRLVEAYVEKVGFELISNNNCAGDLSWMELRKPGNIESIRGGQAMAKILAKLQ